MCLMSWLVWWIFGARGIGVCFKSPHRTLCNASAHFRECTAPAKGQRARVFTLKLRQWTVRMSLAVGRCGNWGRMGPNVGPGGGERGERGQYRVRWTRVLHTVLFIFTPPPLFPLAHRRQRFELGNYLVIVGMVNSLVIRSCALLCVTHDPVKNVKVNINH